MSEIESLMTESLATYRLRPSNRKRFRNSHNLIGVGSGGGGEYSTHIFLQFLCETGKYHKCTKLKGKNNKCNFNLI